MKPLLVCEGGTASVEVVVMLPVFLILLFGVYQVHSTTLQSQLALSEARGCSYHYAVRGCTDDAAEDEVCKGANPGKTTGVDGYTDETRGTKSVLDSLQSEWGVLGSVIGAVFGEGSRAKVTRKYSRDGQTAEATQSFYMLCNTEPSSFGGHLSELKDLLDTKGHEEDKSSAKERGSSVAGVGKERP